MKKAILTGVIVGLLISGTVQGVTVLFPTQGGTGLSSYTAGDIIYSDAANSLATLAKGSDYNILHLASGIPAWTSTLGDSTSRLTKIWTADLDVSGTFTLGGTVGTGGMNLDGNTIDNVGVLISNAADPADAGMFRLGNAESIAWEASPAGTDVTLSVDANEDVLWTIGGGDFAFQQATTVSTSTGALTLQPASGSNLNISLATTGDFAVNTDDLYVDTSAGNLGIGDTSPGHTLTIDADSDFGFGNINDNIIGTIDSVTIGTSAGEWEETDTGNTDVATESTIYKKGTGSAKITTTSGSSNSDNVRLNISNTDMSDNDRVGFWIRGTETGQIISLELNDDAGTDPHHDITILEADTWQYEEFAIGGETSTDIDVISEVLFIIDDDTNSPTFYVDHIREYDKDNKSGEMYIDGAGRLQMHGEQGFDLVTNIASNKPAVTGTAANVTFNQPISVDVGGGVGFDYDIELLSTSTSRVTSVGDLWVQGGDANGSDNLYLDVRGDGDVIVDVRDSNATSGGFRVIGSDSGGFVMNVEPGGDVSIGGSGSGGSDLTVKQNVSLTGGNITIGELDESAAGTPSTSVTATGGSCLSTTTYYYRVLAVNDNGDGDIDDATSGSQATGDSGNDEQVTVSWSPVTGATGYKVYRDTDDVWDDGADSLVDGAAISAPTTSVTDDCSGDTGSQTPNSTNDTGGDLTSNGDIIPGTDSLFDLGATGSVFAEGWFDAIKSDGTLTLNTGLIAKSVSAGNDPGTGGQGTNPITTSIYEVSASTAGDDVTLPTAEAGLEITIINSSSNAIDVFPASSDAIGDNGANTSISLAANSRLDCTSFDATNWSCIEDIEE